jgi:hypothetical protein
MKLWEIGEPCAVKVAHGSERGVRHEAVGRAVRVEQNKISPGMLLPVPYQDMRLE